MTKRFAIRQLFHLMCAGGLIGLSSNAMAAAFQLYEQDGASVGNYHAGRAVTDNASTAYYNPAGNTQFTNQEMILGDVGIMSSLKYSGTVSPGIIVPGVGVFPVGPTQSAVAQGGAFSQVPDFHYVAPISKNFGFGLSVAAPFGLKTNFGRNTALRYAATLSELKVIDYSPSLGVSVNDKLSFGVGLDIQRMGAEFDQMGTIGTGTDTDSKTKGWDTAYGFHLGALYHFRPTTRVGLTYNSQVVHHIRGTSKFVGPIANFANTLATGSPGAVVSNYANAHLTLPAATTLSLFHQLNPKWALMGTAIYTQWSIFQSLSIADAASASTELTIFGPVPVPSPNTTVSVPTHYRNTWNFSVGADYYATDKFTFRGGLGYDQTPVKNAYRDVRIPDGDRIAIAVGGHYQASKALGFDLGWTHLFMSGTAKINPPPVVTGGQVVSTNGSVKASADVIGAQVVWDIA
ncbi:MAG: outer membrane protein transport protein [Gammaproteobacteria bacterium]|nr:outer membrane protein transport protein [Gammaproteobacteria bacterium]